MSNELTSVLRDYVVKFDEQEVIPSPDTAWVKRIGVAVKVSAPAQPSDPTKEGIFKVTTRAQIAEKTALASLGSILDAGVKQFYIVCLEDLSHIANFKTQGKFWTLILSENWTDSEVAAQESSGWGDMNGVRARTFLLNASNENTFMDAMRVRKDFCCFATKNAAVEHKNIYYAFGKLLGAEELDNQQYIEMAETDDINDLSLMEDLFDKKVSFVSTDPDYNNRLSLFAVGNAQPIIGPYLEKLLRLDIQAAAITATNLFRPNNTASAIVEIKNYIMTNAISKYIHPKKLPSVSLEITKNNEGWYATGNLTLGTVQSLWRYFLTVIRGE